MSEESLPVAPLTRDEGQDDSRGSTRLDTRAIGARTDAPPPATLHLTRSTVAVAVGAVAFAAVAGSFRRLTAPAELATLTAGALICWLALRRTCRRYPAPDHIDARGALAWGIVLVTFSVWELYADFRGSTPAHPTLSILMGSVLAPPVNRAIGYVAWLAAGVWVVRR